MVMAGRTDRERLLATAIERIELATFSERGERPIDRREPRCVSASETAVKFLRGHRLPLAGQRVHDREALLRRAEPDALQRIGE